MFNISTNRVYIIMIKHLVTYTWTFMIGKKNVAGGLKCSKSINEVWYHFMHLKVLHSATINCTGILVDLRAKTRIQCDNFIYAIYDYGLSINLHWMTTWWINGRGCSQWSIMRRSIFKQLRRFSVHIRGFCRNVCAQ